MDNEKNKGDVVEQEFDGMTNDGSSEPMTDLDWADKFEQEKDCPIDVYPEASDLIENNS